MDLRGDRTFIPRKNNNTTIYLYILSKCMYYIYDVTDGSVQFGKNQKNLHVQSSIRQKISSIY